MVVCMNEADMSKLGLDEGSVIDAALDEIDRSAGGFNVVAYDVPKGCCAAYYPEANALLSLADGTSEATRLPPIHAGSGVEGASRRPGIQQARSGGAVSYCGRSQHSGSLM